MNKDYLSIILSQLPQDKRDVFLSRYHGVEKNTVIGVFLAWVLGTVGAHKFYMGEYNFGWAYLLFSWSLVPTFLGFIDAFGIPAKVSKYNFQKAIGIASEVSAITKTIEISQPAKDVVYNLVSDFDFRQHYFDNQTDILKKYELTEVEKKAFSRVNRQSFDRISSNGVHETLGKVSDNAIVNQLLNVISESTNFLSINPNADLCPKCFGAGTETISSKGLLELKQTYKCVACIGHGFSIPSVSAKPKSG